MADHLDLTALRKAIQSLDRAVLIVEKTDWFSQQSIDIQETLVAGAIQHFECAYELGVKMIRRQLESGSDNPASIDAMNFRDVLRLAGETGLIEDVKHWFTYREMRNITSHTYDHQKADTVYQAIVPFLNDARQLLQQLEMRNVG